MENRKENTVEQNQEKMPLEEELLDQVTGGEMIEEDGKELYQSQKRVPRIIIA